MPNEAQNTTEPQRWSEFENKFKRGIIVGGAALAIALTAVFGTQALYLLLGSIAIGTYALYTDEVEKSFNDNKPIFYGAAVGFIYGNVIGMVLGAWLGHEINQKVNRGMQTVNNVSNRINQIAETVEPYTHPLNYTQRKANELWNTLKENFSWILESNESELPSEEPLNLTEQGHNGNGALIFQGAQAQASSAPISQPRNAPRRNCITLM